MQAVKAALKLFGREAEKERGAFRRPSFLAGFVDQVQEPDQREDQYPDHSAVASSTAGVSCFLKWSRAAWAASGVMSQDVFFASTGRANDLRRNPRSDLGSQPISSASAFGVMVSDMVHLLAPRSREAFDECKHIIHTGSCRVNGDLYGDCKHLLNAAMNAAHNACDTQVPPLPPPPKDPLTTSSLRLRAKRAGFLRFGLQTAAYGVNCSRWVLT